MRNKAGFTMTEMLIALFILAVGTMLFCNFKTCPDLSYYQFPSRYVLKQSEAIRTGKPQTVEVLHDEIHFNAAGNVRQARSVSFPRHPRITIGLGTGRLVFHEDE